jgi:hypothetical protein
MNDLKDATETLAKLLQQRDDLEITIARQRKRAAALAELCDESEFGKPFDFNLGGLTEVCRTAMRASRKEWMTIANIQQAIKEIGYPLDKYKAPTASIMTTINRMVNDDEIAVEQHDKAWEYKYVGLGQKSANSLRDAYEAFKQAHDTKLAREKTKQDRG